MTNALVNTLRLAKAAAVLAQHGVRFLPPGQKAPFALTIAHSVTWPLRTIAGLFSGREAADTRLSRALASLGPSYIKLGQFMATRADIIGPDLAKDLSRLQDRLPPFSMAEARAAIEAALGGKLEDHFAEFGPPVAAASIAQVHKAIVIENDERKTVAVKILRPNIEKRFKRDLDSFTFAAKMIERFHEPSRRLRPLAVVGNLKHTTDLEMDLRLEAAAMSEMAENIRGESDFRVPTVDWKRTAKRVLTSEWIDGIPIANHAALQERGHDKKALGLTILRSFLLHAMRDGFFHADMHQGNLFVDDKGSVVAVDFGIMGRIGPRERRFLAEILHGLITRDYTRAAQVHFWAGYVPPHHPVEVFAQALRAVGEPIHGRAAIDVSMADLLGQLFAYTDVFEMQTRPELILLQKSMVIVEGVARQLDPELNLFSTAEPVARAWMEENLGPMNRIREAGEGANAIVNKAMLDVPRLIDQIEQTASAFSSMTRDGFRLDERTVSALARAEAKESKLSRAALWIGALSLAALALHQFGVV